jgi:hypothetical protein
MPEASTRRLEAVMAGLDPATHVPDTAPLEKAWITGSSAVVTFRIGII